jgi:hypothetical protein
MKKILFFVAFAATVFAASAVDKTWTFDGVNAFGTGPGLTAAQETKTIDGLTFNNGTNTNTNFCAITTNNKTINGVPYTHRMQLNGAGYGTGANSAAPTQRYLSFNVSGNSTIQYAFITGSSSATRSIIISDGTQVLKAESDANVGTYGTYSYTGGAATLYVYGDAAINIYMLAVSNLAAAVQQISADLLAKQGDALVNPTGLEVEILSVTGASVLKSSEASISLASLPKGIYIAKTSQGTLKFIK